MNIVGPVGIVVAIVGYVQLAESSTLLAISVITAIVADGLVPAATLPMASRTLGSRVLAMSTHLSGR